MLKDTNCTEEASRWGIKDIAREFDTTPRTLRFYEDKGLISPAREGGARIYDREDYRRIKEIMRSKRIGFSLDDIKEVFDVLDGRVLDRTELLRRKSNFERVAASLKRRQSDIDMVARNLTRLARRIQKYVDDPARDSAVLHLADAYDAVFRQHLDDDFSEDKAALSASNSI